MIRTAMWALVLMAGVLFPLAVTADDKSKDAPKDEKKGDTAYSDAEFVKKAGMSGMAEVELGKLATTQAKSDDVKKLAQKLVDDHTKANEGLKAAAKKASLDVPASVGDEHQKHIDHMKGLKGDEFDKAYIKHMVEGHEKSVALFTTASKDAKDAGLKEFATKTLPTIKEHLEMAKKLDKGGK